MTVYQLTLRTLSPIHIGEGRELRQDFDFAVYQKRTYRLNEDALLLAKEDRLIPDRGGRYPAPGHLLESADFRNPALFRYVLRGQPRSQKTDARVQSFIKDVYDRPYIPGSSLKGAIRTALGWSGWPEVRPPLDVRSLKASKSWAGQPLEAQLFRPAGRHDPNHDLLRALQVSDLAGPDKPGMGLQLVNAQVITRRDVGSPIELEALSGDLVFQGTLTIDETLFGPSVENELRFGSRRLWLDELMIRIQQHSQAQIEKLAIWFLKTEGGERLAAFYRDLSEIPLGPDKAFIQLGWGTGWDGKTFGSRLEADSDFFEEIIQKYRLQRTGRGGAQRQKGAPFPGSRRVVTLGKGGDSQAVHPFGWALIEQRQVDHV
jgi:CRISPR-associated protein Csm5